MAEPGSGRLRGSSGLGTNVWVDPSFPGQVLNFGPSAPGGCIALPIAIPAAVPTGVNVFFQWLFLNSSFIAVDATEGCAFTIDAP